MPQIQNANKRRDAPGAVTSHRNLRSVPGGQPRHFNRPASGHPKIFKIQAPNGPFSNPTRPAVDGSDRTALSGRGAALEGTRLGRPIRRPSPRAHYKTAPFLGHKPISFPTPLAPPLSLPHPGRPPRFRVVNAAKSLPIFRSERRISVRYRVVVSVPEGFSGWW